MRFKKCLSGVLAMAMVLGTGNISTLAAENGKALTSDTQTVSEPETVYVNSYGAGERSVSFNDHWRFYLGDASGAQAPAYNDSSWEDVNLPHDYSIEQGFSTAAPAEQESGYMLGGTGWYRKVFTVSEDMQGKNVSIDFDGVYMNAAVYLNGQQLGTHPYGYTSFSFVLPQELLKFGGQENVLAVKVDHKQPSSRWYSGSGIYRDVNLTVTDSVHMDRFGTRVTTPDIEQGKGTVQVAASVRNDSETEARISIQHTVYQQDGTQPVTVGEKTSERSVPAGQSVDIMDAVNVEGPELWTTDAPNMYTVRTDVYAGETLVDSYETDFGFRWTTFTKDNGFFINGKNVKLKGVCMHHDQGALGAEAWYRSVERQVELLQEMGVNAIRVTHNPASQILIDICNRKGMMLVEEAFDSWLSGKAGNTEDYGKWFDEPIEEGNQIVGAKSGEKWSEFDLKEMIRRGRNAPSIIMWSLGNEVFQQNIDSSRHEEYPDVAKELIQWTAQEDTTRYVTFGDNWFKGNEWGSGVATRTADVFAAADQYGVPGGLPGYNYGSSGQIQNGYNKGWMVYGSETASAVNSRGVYDRKDSNSDGGAGDRRMTSYDKSSVSWGHRASAGLWITMRQPYNAGEFVWTGFDYGGEPTPYNWQGPGANGTWPNVAKSSYFGILDTAGIPKDSFYLYQSQWNDYVNTLHVLPVWDKDEIMLDGSGKAEVVVYSDAPVIRLYLNGEEVGTAAAAHTDTPTGGYQTYTSGTGCFDTGKASGDTSLYATFQVPYEEGKLEAKAFKADGTTPIMDTEGRSLVETSSNPTRLRAAADRSEITADGRDLSYITLEVTDSDGRFVNEAEPEIKVSVSGDGKLLALDNGVQNDVTAYTEPVRKAGKGKLVAIVQSTEEEGSFTVTAASPGYAAATATVTTARKGEAEPGKKDVVSYYTSRNYYVKQGTKPQLPDELTVNYSDGTSENKEVTWDSIPEEQNSYSVSGTIEDINLRISVNVTEIGHVAGVLNYSAAIGKDAVISLPQTRPAITSDGTVIAAEFPVTWEMSEDLTSKLGTKIVRGTASVFDQSFEVTASVRVTNGSYLDGDEALPNVPEMYIGEVSSKTDSGAADVLSRLKDGRMTKEDVAWSGRGTLDFRLDTAIDLKDFTLYLKDTAPTSDTIRIYSSSNNGASWIPADCRVANRRGDGVTVRTYTPAETVSETWFRIEFTRQTTLLELEMNTRIPSFPVGEEAALESLKAGGYTADPATLKKGSFGVPETALQASDITAVGKDNASVTVLDKDRENVIRILLESEDHTRRSIYPVLLGRDNSASDDPSDASKDYPFADMTLHAPSVEKGGSAAWANDGDSSSIWHSNWGGGTGPSDLTSDPDNRYLEIELPAVTRIDAVRYLPRNGSLNGVVTGYSIKVSTDRNSWKEVSNGSWSTAVEWKLAMFDAAEAKWIRLYAADTASSEGNPRKFMSAAEVRVRCAPDGIYSGNTTVTLSKEEQSVDYTGQAVTPWPAVVYKSTPEAEGITLEKDIDYTLSYRNNIQPGEAAVVVTGKGSYSGVAEAKFTINSVETVVMGYEAVAVTTGKGEVPMLPGTVIADTNVGRQVLEVRWDKVGNSILNSFGSFTVDGTVIETGARIPAEITVSDIIGVRQVTLTTVKGMAPVMPEEVLIYYSNGDTANRSAHWDLSSADFNTTGIAEVSGTAGKAKILATVRVEEGNQDANNTPIGTNLALNADGADKPAEWPRTFAYISSEGDPAHHATNGVKNFDSTSSKKIWSDWERNQYHTNADAAVGAVDHLPFVATAFGVDGSAGNGDQKRYTVNRVSLGFTEEDGSSEHKVRLPLDYKIEYYSANDGVISADRLVNNSAGECSNTRGWGADNPIKAHDGWTEVTYLGEKPSVPDLESFKKMMDVSFVSVETTAIRVTLTPQAGNWTGLEEFEVYYDPIQENRDFEVTGIQIDGKDVLGQFDPETRIFNAKALAGDITATATDNASVTVLEAVGRTAKIIFLPENGDENRKQEYTVNFAASQAEASYLVASEEDLVELETGRAIRGEIVTFRAATGYEFPSGPVLVKSADRTETNIEVSEKDGIYSFVMPDYPVTISGKAVPVAYRISYVLNGGQASENPDTYTIESPSFILKNPVMEGSVFLGWTNGSASEPAISMRVKAGTTGDLTFTANWRQGTRYTVTFDCNGGTEVASQEVEMTEGKAVEPEKPKKRGFDFIGWYRDPQLQKVWTFDSDTVDSDMTLYAKWEEADVTVHTKLPVCYFNQPFDLPESIRVTVAEETFDTEVTWNSEDLKAVMQAAELGRYPVTGALAELNGREIEVEITASPDDIIYFIDSGASAFSDKGRMLVDANADTIRNLVPDQAFEEGSGWGFTNNTDTLEVNGAGDAYSTIRNFKSDVTGQTLTYRLALEAGAYEVAVGFYDPWSQWAGDARHAKITLNDAAGEELAAHADHHISGNKEMIRFHQVAVTEDGSVSLNIAPLKTGSNSDVMVSFIVISGEVEKSEADKSGLKAALLAAQALKEEDYTVSSYQILMEAITEAKAVYEDKKATEEQVQVQIDSLAAAVNQLKVPGAADYQELLKELKEKEGALAAKIQELTAAKEEVTRLTGALTAEQERVSSLTQSLQEAEDQIRQLEESGEDKEFEITELKARTEELKEQLSAAQKMVEELDKKLTDAQVRITELKTENERLEGAVAAAKADAKKAWEEVEKAREEAEKAQKEAEEAIKKAQEELRKAQEEAKRAKAEAEKLRAELEAQKKNAALKKGDTVTVNSVKYRVTNAAKKQAEAFGVSNKNSKRILVADTVKIKGTTCRVTAIADGAFTNLKKLNRAAIGKNVVTIGRKAFYGDKKLKNIVINSSKMKTVGKLAWKGIPAKAVIKVPAAKKNAYVKLMKGKGQKRTVKIK